MSIIASGGRPKYVSKGVVFDPQQLQEDNSLAVVTTITALPAPPAALLSGTSAYEFEVNCSGIHRWMDAYLRLDLTNTANSCILTDAPHWFSRIEFLDQRGNVFYRSYGDALSFQALALKGPGQITAQYLKHLSISKGAFEGGLLPASASASYRVPLNTCPFTQMQHYMANLNKFRIRLYPLGSFVSSGTGVPTVSNIYLEIFEQRVNDAVVKIERSKFNMVQRNRFIMPDQITLANQTLTASTAARFSLAQFVGNYSHLMFMVRASNSTAANNALLNTLDLGPTSTVDIQSPSGTSILGGGIPIRAGLLLDRSCEHFPNADVFSNRRYYVLPFVSRIRDSYQGVKSGGLQLDGSPISLVVTPSADGVATVQTITVSGGPATAGLIQFAFMGSVSNPVAYNIDAATIKATLEALPSFKHYPGGPLIVTASGAASNTFTLTFNKYVAQPVDDLVQVINISAAAAGTVLSYTTTLTTGGTNGWNTASTYAVDIYGWHFQDYSERRGEITIQDA